MLTLAYFCLLLVVAFVSHVVGSKTGYWKGWSAAKTQEATFLSKRIDAAKAGVTKITVNDFEAHALSTVTSELYGTPDWFTHVSFKLFGEAGEFAEHVGKASRDDGWSIFKGPKDLTPERRLALLKELGDILWYVVTCAKELGSNLAEVMMLNIEKRDGRKKRGTLKGAGDDR